MHLVRCSGGEEDELEFEFPPPPGQFKFTGKCSSPLSVSRTLNKSIWGEFPFTLDEEVWTPAANPSRPLMMSSSAAVKLITRSIYGFENHQNSIVWGGFLNGDIVGFRLIRISKFAEKRIEASMKTHHFSRRERCKGKLMPQRWIILAAHKLTNCWEIWSRGSVRLPQAWNAFLMNSPSLIANILLLKLSFQRSDISSCKSNKKTIRSGNVLLNLLRWKSFMGSPIST